MLPALALIVSGLLSQGSTFSFCSRPANDVAELAERTTRGNGFWKLDSKNSIL